MLISLHNKLIHEFILCKLFKIVRIADYLTQEANTLCILEHFSWILHFMRNLQFQLKLSVLFY